MNAEGIDTNVITFVNVQISNTGFYQCVTTNASGNTSSNFAYLYVNGECIFTYFVV